MKIIGLTGGIGTGKSTVSAYLKNKNNFEIVDADFLAKKALRKGNKVVDEIKKEFGNQVVMPNGEIDRIRLGNIVFNDEEKLKILESIVTTKVCDTINRIVLEKRKTSTTCKNLVIDAPLLFEKNLDKLCDVTWLVTCDMTKRLNRINQRDNLTMEQIKKRIDTQYSDFKKKKLADFVIDNSGTLEQLYEQIEDLVKGM